MASNNGRGPTRRDGFRFTDTVAEKGTLQGVLRKQDEIIARVNAILDTFIGSEVTAYNAFAAVGNSGKDEAILDTIIAEFTAGFIAINPVLGSSTVATAYAAGATSLVVASVDALGTRGSVVRLFIEATTMGDGAVFLATLPTTGNTITVTATDINIAAAVNNRVVNIVSEEAIALGTDLIVVDVQN